MKRTKRILGCIGICILFLLGTTEAFAEETVNVPARTQVSIIKPWTVNFNIRLDKNSINTKNIIVTDNNENVVKCSITLANDNKSLIVSPPTGGYIPNKSYYLTLTTNIKSASQKNLSKPVRMKFTTSKQYQDCSKHSSLPLINDIKFTNGPILRNQKVNFSICPNYSGKVQYRIFAFKYPNEIYDNVTKYNSTQYKELTAGYTSIQEGTSSYPVSIYNGFDEGKYKLIVYVKRANKVGKFKDENSDYDNFYSTYFKVLDSNVIDNRGDNESLDYTEYNKTLGQAVEDQMSGAPTYYDNGWNIPSDNLVSYYMNGHNFLANDYKYLFLNLNYMEVSATDLNNMLKGKGVLEGKGKQFLQAAKTNNVNPIYLLSHALLETGNGTSKLAKGIQVSSIEGDSVDPKVTYNIFGIHAYDGNPNKFGSEYAYSQGWFTIDEAIMGGAKFISTGYINSEKYKQNTLYKMRWNINVTWHQYATDIGWAKKQVPRIKALIESCKSAKPVYDIPRFK